ncbi:hypothetical protein P9430_25175, partial [Citrobacter freundii]
RLDKGILGSIQTQLSPTITRVNQTLDSLRYTIGAINAVFDPRTQNNLQDVIANLALASAHLQQLLNAQSGLLAQSLTNLNSV